MMLIRNTAFVDFALQLFLQLKLSIVDECLATENTNKALID